MPQSEPQIGRRFASRLIHMVDTSLVTYRYTIPWADNVIESMDSPPAWICELALTKYQTAISAIARGYLYTENFTAWNTPEERDDYHLACLYLRYIRNELSWAIFLKLAGEFTDTSDSQRPCEYFYEMLNQLETAEFSKKLEMQQEEEVKRELGSVIESVRVDYEPLLTAFRSRYRSGEM